MDLSESPKEAEFRAEARSWIAQYAPQHLRDRLERAPIGALDFEDITIAEQQAWQKQKFEAGWACLHWPRDYGGRAASPAERLIWHEEEGIYAKLSALFHNGQGMCAPTLMAHATEDQKKKLIPKIASGEEVWCQLFSEPGAGSDLAGLRTRVQKDGDHWVLNGQKTWTSGGQHAQWGLLIARSDVDVPKHKGLTAFFVDMRSPGIEVHPIRQMNDRSEFNNVFITDMRIPDPQRLGAVGEGWQVALTTLMNERLSIGLEMRTGFEDLFSFCETVRTETGRAIDELHVQRRIAQFAATSSGLRNFLLGMISRASQGETPGPEGSVIKLVAGRTMQEIAAYALDLQNEKGIVASDPETKFAGVYQDMLMRAPATRIEGGTDQILRNIIAERVLGLPADLRADKNIPFKDIKQSGA